jgi:hypothetical protein
MACAKRSLRGIKLKWTKKVVSIDTGRGILWAGSGMGSCSSHWAGGLPRRKLSDNEQGDIAEAFKWTYFLEGFRSCTPPYPPTHTIFALNLPGNWQTEHAGTSHRENALTRQ